MFRTGLQKPIIVVLLIALIIIGFIFGFLCLDHKLLWSRGYGLISRPLSPNFIASMTFFHPVSKFLNEYAGESDRSLPEARAIAANIPKVTLAGNQPYTKLGIYVLESRKTKQFFLYSPNNIVDNSSKIRQMKNKFSLSEKDKRGVFHARGAGVVVACVMATRESEAGMYEPYQNYPLALKKAVGLEAWKTWGFLRDLSSSDYRYITTYHVYSNIPPIPGCLAYTDQTCPQFDKFYYPEEILPVFKAIYPNADVPEEQILREGRDY